MQVFLGLGSNLDAEQNINLALEQLGRLFGEIRCSSRYRTAALGFEGPAFINMAVAVETKLGVEDLTHRCQMLERQLGRARETEQSMGSRPIDIDLLLFIDKAPIETLPAPRRDIRDFAYAAVPLADLIPDWRHELIGDLTLAEYIETGVFAGQTIERLVDR